MRCNMKKVEELKIGEEFQLGDRRFRIEKEGEEFCEGCFFLSTVSNDVCEELKLYDILPQCASYCRKDKTSVIFKEVENNE